MEAKNYLRLVKGHSLDIDAQIADTTISTIQNRMWANHDVPGNMWNNFRYKTDSLFYLHVEFRVTVSSTGK
jgi:hypothetical protein